MLGKDELKGYVEWFTNVTGTTVLSTQYCSIYLIRIGDLDKAMQYICFSLFIEYMNEGL